MTQERRGEFLTLLKHAQGLSEMLVTADETIEVLEGEARELHRIRAALRREIEDTAETYWHAMGRAVDESGIGWMVNAQAAAHQGSRVLRMLNGEEEG